MNVEGIEQWIGLISPAGRSRTVEGKARMMIFQTLKYIKNCKGELRNEYG